MSIDPSVITLAQTTFLQHIAAAFAVVAHYALNLLYLFAALEVVLFGIGWALQQSAAWGQLFLKVIKIGLIFVIIQNYPDLLSAIINSFATIAGIVVHKAKMDALIFNPAQIWQYGYNVGVHLLQSATQTNVVGLILVLVLLGIGILLVFALFGIQVVVQLVGFYVVALVSLIFLPLGVFQPGRKMFDKSVQAVLQAGIRVMAIIMVVGVAAVVWDNFDLKAMAAGTVSLNQTLGLFFSMLLFVFLASYLPRFAALAVGEISSGGMETSAAVGGSGVVGVAAPRAAMASGVIGGGGEIANHKRTTVNSSWFCCSDYGCRAWQCILWHIVWPDCRFGWRRK